MFEFELPFGVGTKGVTGMRLPLRLKGEHFAGIIEDRSDGVFLRPRPFRIGRAN